MPWLTDLDDALRAGGIGFWADPNWRGRGQGPLSGNPRAIMIHHTAGGGANDWRLVRDGRAGLRGLLSQMTFERDGGVRLLGAGQAWHAGTGSHPRIGTNNANAWTIGIEGVSRGVGNDWTAAQRREYPRVAAALCRHYRLPADAVIGHKEWTSRKIDPGDWDMNDFRAAVRRHLGAAPAPTPTAPAPAPKPKGLPEMIERPLSKGLNAGRVVCPTGTASSLVARSWVSVSVEFGARVQLWFQKGARSDGPPPGAGPAVDWTLLNAERPYAEIPSGTEYIEYRITADGPGSLLIEQKPR